jgi:hypothetical protein
MLAMLTVKTGWLNVATLSSALEKSIVLRRDRRAFPGLIARVGEGMRFRGATMWP